MNLRQNKEKNAQQMLTGVILTLFIMLLLCTIFTNQDAASVSKLKARQPDKIQYLDDGMVLLSFNINRNESNNGSLVFFTSHQHVTVSTKNNEIYRLDDSGGIWGHTTGNVWNFVKLPTHAETVIVRLEPCYPETAGQIEQYYIGTGNEIYTGILRQSMPTFIASVFILLAGFFITCYWVFIHNSSHIDGTLFYLGIFSILLGLWTANETDVCSLMLLNRRSSAFAAFMFLMIMPIPFLMFVKSFLEINDDKIWKIICDLCILQTVVCSLLHFTGFYEFRRSIWITHISICMVLVYLIAVIIYKIVKKQTDQKLKACMMALTLVIIATIVDMVGYYKTGNNSGMFGRSSFLVFIIILGLESARQAVTSLKKRRRMEELEQFALNDSMTGLYNRNAYDYFINNESDIKNHMVVTFDLNNLKMCNDNYGHSAGDAYIINSAHIIETAFDRFGKCYRIGGDEFCCLIPDAAEFQIEHFIQKMHQDVAILNNKNIIPTEVEIACGYALVTPDDTDIEKVRERADEMMYHNKKVLKGLI